MTINKFNYEAFALDYLEGKLSLELTEEMERFLATHPAIESELSGMMEVVYLEPDTSIFFEDKAALLKEEKVVWLRKKMTYFSGYQAGVKQVDSVAVNQEESSDSGNNNSTSVAATIDKAEMVKEDKTSKLPVVEEMKLEKTIARFVPKSSVQDKVINRSKATVEKEQLENIVVDKPKNIIVDGLQFAENELVGPPVGSEALANKPPIIVAPIALIKPNLVISINQDNSLNNLSNALDVAVPVEELAGITIQKKKRNIKDFLGRFPVTQLKEALIPTYYREENAGQ